MNLYVAIDKDNDVMIAGATLKELIKTAINRRWLNCVYDENSDEYVFPEELYGEDWMPHILQMDLEELNRISYHEMTFYEIPNNEEICID